MGHIREVLSIQAPIERVWEFLADYARAPEWQSNVIEVKDFEGTPGEVGFSYTAIYKAMGRRLESRSTIAKAERPRFLEENGSMPGGGEVTMTNALESTPDGGTTVTFTFDYELGAGFLGQIADRLVFERQIERDVRHSGENLKELVEAEVAVSA